MKSCALAIVLAIASSCDYTPEIRDCRVACDPTSGCPSGLSCSSEGLCRTGETSTSCAAILGKFPSCDGLAPTCGPAANDDCCSTTATIPGGTFYRSYDVAGDGMYPSMSAPATISPFVLDKYEVSVGRFRKFVEAQKGTRQQPPAPGDGNHPHLANSGWDPNWNASLALDTASLVAGVKCDATWQTWTDDPGGNESLPINCVTWYEAMAFCIWDGGYLPTRAEWDFAASGGDEQRAYPWSSPAGSIAIDCSYANEVNPPGIYCVGALNRVGSESPKGDGRWGQSDLAGNTLEWTLDWVAQLETPCTDCAALAGGTARALLSGAFNHDARYQRINFVNQVAPADRIYVDGIRCARPVP